MAKHAGVGAAIAVVLAIFGLIFLVGVILLMMWTQSDIEHHPTAFRRTVSLPNSRHI